MGAVAMWCMHFISDHAIKILDGQPEHQILYKPGYTVTSFFLPVVVVAISLFYFDLSETAGVLSTVIGGIFTSVAICGMHYLGEQGVSNYIISYDPGHVGAAISLAVATNILGLGIFSYLRKSWNDTCLKRFGCAWFLASANTSMHWIAASGTVYRFKPNAAIIEGSLSREAAVIIVICLVENSASTGQAHFRLLSVGFSLLYRSGTCGLDRDAFQT